MALPQLPALVIVRDVGPRDGLQPEPPRTVEERVRLIAALVEAGVHRIEVASFVSPTAVPAMAGAAEVMAFVPRHTIVRYTALVPNVKGAELALETDVDELTVIMSMSEEYNQRNVNRSIEQSLAEVEAICALADEVPVDAVVSCCFGSPYEGDISPRAVGQTVQRLREVGCAAVTCADTTGMATPKRIEDVLSRTGTDVGLHLHETRGTALVNAFAAMQLGVDRFDTSIGGLGGSPFAAGAAGNLATEDLVAILDDLGVRTGIDLDKLLRASEIAAELVDHPLPSRVAAVGPRSRLAGGT